MIVGESITLKAIISPSNATDREVIWASSKQSVASVDQSGRVVAIAEGTSTITAIAGGKIGSCVVTVSKGVVDVSSINLDKTSASLKVGETVTLTATVKPDDATDKTVTWSTSDASVATIADGVITAIKLGSATITAKAGDKKATCSITVEATPVTSVTLDKTSASLKVGETVSLAASVKPDDATDKTVTWSTSDASVATVSEGVVTAVKLGSANITAKAGEKEATCAITVEATPVNFITLDKTSASLKVGETVTLTATVKPDDATDKTVTWSTSDASVATVSEGVVTAVKLGSANITAKAGEKEATCAITVEASPVTSVTLDKTSASLKVGEKVTLTVTVSPSSATDKSVSWSSNSTTVATVSSSGVVTAIKAGSATITVKTNDGGKTATCSVTVKAATVPVTGVSLNTTSLSLKVGEKVTLTATVSPSSATDKSVTWSSNNTTVATVSSSGVVTAIKAGSATITVKTSDGGKTATCSVTVKASSSGQEAVDLGLPSGLKWGSCNIGASKPEEYGDYFAWGETENKKDYSESTYKWYNGTYESITKYNTSTSYGTVDNKTVLDAEDDVAHVKLGGNWRMPTDAEWTELRDNCTWTWTTQNGVRGRLVTSKKNGNSIFLPAAGDWLQNGFSDAGSTGYYWSSSLITERPYGVLFVYFNFRGVYRDGYGRCYGLSVRPVSE